MVSIDDVARAAGVSTATVSRALSGRGHVSPVTRARVRAAAEVLGYVVSASASSLASGRARNIGVLLPYVDRWFFSTVLSGIAAELMRGGYDITLYSVTDDPDERRRVFETFVRRQRVDGVICVSIALEEEETRRLAELGLPLVALGGPHSGMTTLMVDDVAIGRLAAEHLLSLGHRRIAHIGARPEFDLDFHVPAQRRRGFEQALQDAGVPARADLFEPADFTVAGGHRAATRLLGAVGTGRLSEAGRLSGRSGTRGDAGSGAPTAILAASDEMAIGALLAARDLGLRVPEDVSILGVDGHELGEFFGLTTIDQGPRQQGERAASAMLGLLDPRRPAAGGDARADVTRRRRGTGTLAPAPLPFRLVERGSTGPAPR
ncbi:LacI family DNA-binding transcriptional regulator [Microbacterium sp. 1P10UB]|uniref:LacI family DNA-binding transcriptional regulator n=1 Tax=unclassified Microbacterium TaxID=2609290 RepID=UPI0039A1475B